MPALPFRDRGTRSRLAAWAIAVPFAALALSPVIAVQAEEPLDPVVNVALPCEAVSTPGLVPRSAKDIVHLANICGFVGTDIEFQSRTAADGTVHDYAFVGTMGAGTRIFDITDPRQPFSAGGYLDPGYQNDVSVRGDLLVLGFDSIPPTGATSTCLKQKSTAANVATRGGLDIVRLTFDPVTATFQTSLIDCYLSVRSTAGAHTVTIHPSGRWISVNTSFDGLEVVDMRSGVPVFARHVPVAVVDDAHDVSFSADGNTLYSAGISSTRIVDVTDVFNRAPTVLGVVPNAASAAQGADGQNIAISHQSDTSVDGAIFVVTDEAGGGVTETGCNTGPGGKTGGAHFWALREIAGVARSLGAGVATPKKLGTWLYPQPIVAPDPLAPALAAIGRAERGCTIHVFRNGGNGTAGPGEIAPGFGGVSSLPPRQFVTAHYGAGVWHVDFSAAASSTDGTAENPAATWGNSLGWNIMPGADTWSAKEYKGRIFTGDMARGFDVYGFADCDGVGCVSLPEPNTPGKATGGGQVPGESAEMSIIRGSSAGGKANFGFNAAFEGGVLSGHLNFKDKATSRHVSSTAIDSYTQTANRARFTGRAIVNGVPGIAFSVEVEDLGEPGTSDTFRLLMGDGYMAGGVLIHGNIQVHSPGG